MNTLVIGGAGFIGSHTVKALCQAGHTVSVFDSFEKGHSKSLEALVPSERIFKGNILDSNTLDEVFAKHSFDAVIHFAAYIEAGESVIDPGKFFQNNTAGAISIINTMLKHSVHQLVFSSTAAVYGNPKTMPIPETAVDVPTNPYGTSKLLVEQAIADYTQFTPLKATILRYFNAAGADHDGHLGENHQPETHLIPLILQVALGQREKIKLFGTDYPTPDGTNIRDYIHVDDLARAHVMALETQATSEDKLWIFNVGTGHGYSVKEVVAMARKVTGHPIPTEGSPRREGDPVELVADASKIQAKLGWKAERSDLETIVADAWQWLNQNPHGYRD